MLKGAWRGVLDVVVAARAGNVLLEPRIVFGLPLVLLHAREALIALRDQLSPKSLIAAQHLGPGIGHRPLKLLRHRLGLGRKLVVLRDHVRGPSVRSFFASANRGLPLARGAALGQDLMVPDLPSSLDGILLPLSRQSSNLSLKPVPNLGHLRRKLRGPLAQHLHPMVRRAAPLRLIAGNLIGVDQALRRGVTGIVERLQRLGIHGILDGVRGCYWFLTRKLVERLLGHDLLERGRVLGGAFRLLLQLAEVLELRRQRLDMPLRIHHLPEAFSPLELRGFQQRLHGAGELLADGRGGLLQCGAEPLQVQLRRLGGRHLVVLALQRSQFALCVGKVLPDLRVAPDLADHTGQEQARAANRRIELPFPRHERAQAAGGRRIRCRVLRPLLELLNLLAEPGGLVGKRLQILLQVMRDRLDQRLGAGLLDGGSEEHHARHGHHHGLRGPPTLLSGRAGPGRGHDHAHQPSDDRQRLLHHPTQTPDKPRQDR